MGVCPGSGVVSGCVLLDCTGSRCRHCCYHPFSSPLVPVLVSAGYRCYYNSDDYQHDGLCPVLTFSSSPSLELLWLMGILVVLLHILYPPRWCCPLQSSLFRSGIGSILCVGHFRILVAFFPFSVFLPPDVTSSLVSSLGCVCLF